MRADQHDFIRQLTTAELADHVGRVGIWQGLWPQREMQLGNIPPARQSVQKLCIFDRYTGRWDVLGLAFE